jgi:hypothetical protein
MSRRSQRRRKNKRRYSRGGAGTASWQAYGGIGEQRSNPSEGNLIQSKVGGSSLSPAKVGGKKQQQQGAGILNDLALTAALIYANNAYGKSRRSSPPSFSRKSSFSRRNSFSRRRSASRRA